jgi:hypothetical protein
MLGSGLCMATRMCAQKRDSWAATTTSWNVQATNAGSFCNIAAVASSLNKHLCHHALCAPSPPTPSFAHRQQATCGSTRALCAAARPKARATAAAARAAQTLRCRPTPLTASSTTGAHVRATPGRGAVAPCSVCCQHTWLRCRCAVTALAARVAL